MKEFIVVNWFKLGILIVLSVIAGSTYYNFVISKSQIKPEETTVKTVAVESSVATSTIIEPPQQSHMVTVKKNVIVESHQAQPATPVPVVQQTSTETPSSPVVNAVVDTGYSQQAFVSEINQIYTKINVDFLEYANKDAMSFMLKKNIYGATNYINTGFNIVSKQKAAVVDMGSRYKKLSYDDSMALYNMRKAVEYYYIALTIEKSAALRQGADYGITASEASQIVEDNALGDQYLKDVYNYLVLQ
jgi:hypothetical protein